MASQRGNQEAPSDKSRNPSGVNITTRVNKHRLQIIDKIMLGIRD